MDNKKIVINTGIQYLRMIIVCLVGLISVRVILNTLGIEDYGLYNVLAGIIGLLSYITSSFNQTSFRYLSYSLGSDSISDVSKIFTQCLVLHTIIGLSLVIILESLGLLFIKSLLNIPVERLDATFIVFHFMVLQIFLAIVVTPYSALVMAHEKFNLIALVSVLDSILKLVVAYILGFSQSDKLIFYSILLSSISLLNFVIYYLYDRYKYKDLVRLQFSSFSFKNMKKMISFAGWTLLDSLSIVSSRQGYAVMLNYFSGVKINAIYGIARQVEGQVCTISSTIVDTIKPQIMMQEASGNRNTMMSIAMSAGKFGFAMMAMFSIPLMFFMNEVMNIWLSQVPEGVVSFTNLIIIAALVNQITSGLVYANQAIGNIKLFSVIISSFRILSLPISSILLANGSSPIIAMVVFVICESLGSFARIIAMKYIGGLDIKLFIKNVFVKILAPLIASVLICLIFKIYTDRSICYIIIAFIVSAISYCATFYCCSLTENEQILVKRMFVDIRRKLIK